MAPSDDKIEKALVDAVYHIFKTDNDNLTVNSARQHAAAALDLDANFFKESPEWKDRSKDLIKDLAVRDLLSFLTFSPYVVTISHHRHLLNPLPS